MEINLIHTLFINSSLCALILYIIPEAKSKPIVEIGCACFMIISLLQPLLGLNEKDLLSSIDDMTSNITAQTKDIQLSAEQLSESIISGEYAEYILNEAKAYSIDMSVRVITKDSMPYEIIYETDDSIPNQFKTHIAETLLVPLERQMEIETTKPD